MPDEKNIDKENKKPEEASDSDKKERLKKISEEIASKPSKVFESEEEEGKKKESKVPYEPSDKKAPNKEPDEFSDYYMGDSNRAFDKDERSPETEGRTSLAVLLRYASGYIRHLISLDDDKANEQQTIDQIKRNVVFRGTNIWILIFAILVASVGLNMNSAAVIIGAMLISPLMGPIMGVGLGVGINDLELIKKAAKNLLVMALISILSSTLYFLITPISDAHSELLARTTPTIFDVLIAFFGGLAGIVAGSRSEKSNAIPGVAIATALMPPLCTAGYGLANGYWEYFSGALYLFFINSVFIAISTFVIVRYLKYPRKQFSDPAIEKRVKVYVLVIALATLVPSVYLAWRVVQKSLFVKNASEFVNQEMDFENAYVIDTEYYKEGDSTSILVTLYGEPVPQSELQKAEKNMERYNLPESCDLLVRQNADQGITSDDLQQINSQIRQDLMKELFISNEEELEQREKTIEELRSELIELRRPMILSEDILKELEINYPNISGFTASRSIFYKPRPSDADSTFRPADTLLLAYAQFQGRAPGRRDRQKLEEWLRVRIQDSTLVLIVE